MNQKAHGEYHRIQIQNCYNAILEIFHNNMDQLITAWLLVIIRGHLIM